VNVKLARKDRISYRDYRKIGVKIDTPYVLLWHEFIIDERRLKKICLIIKK
jgi:hypothetical protein